MQNILERIRFNDESISKKLFTTRFFEIWDKLLDQATISLNIPQYLQLLTLLSFHVFIKDKVDVAIYEAHCSREFDGIDLVSVPTVTAVTTIAMDHIRLLGPTIETSPGTRQVSSNQAILLFRLCKTGRLLRFFNCEQLREELC